MTLNSLRRAFSGLVAEDRPSFKRVDVSPARADDAPYRGTGRGCGTGNVVAGTVIGSGRGGLRVRE